MVIIKLFKSRDAIELEEVIPGKHNKWGNDAILFRVNKGLGKLVTKYGQDAEDNTYEFLLLDDKPLINSYGPEIFCPTCAKILSIGLGRENVNAQIIDTIKQSQQNEIEIKTTYKNIRPLLTLLDNGYYLLTRIELIPTDGEGNFFWNLTKTKKQYMATSDIYYKFHVCSGSPKFILPSQGINCLNEERVNFYLEQARKGVTMSGLAYYYDGFMCTLLDGHHRATAAYMENQTISCLTIIKVTGYSFNEKGKPEAIHAGGEMYEFSLFNSPERIYKYLEKTMKINKQLSTNEIQSILAMCKNADKASVPVSFHGKKLYPDYLTFGFANTAEDVSDEHIFEVKSRRDEEAEFELEMILKKLILEDRQRAFKLSKEIIADPNWIILWEEAFKYLATIDSIEVENIFIDYLVSTDNDPKNPLSKIANEYLNNR